MVFFIRASTKEKLIFLNVRHLKVQQQIRNT